MMLRLKTQPLYRKLAYITLILVLLLLLWQLLIQNYFVQEMRRVHEANMDYVVGETVKGIREALAFQGDAVQDIAEHSDIKDYLATANTVERYRKAYETARPIVQVATANQIIKHVVLYDHTSAWYQFVGTLSFADCRALRTTLAGIDAHLDTVMTLEGGRYLCSAAPVTQMTGPARFDQVGLVVALSDISQFHSVLEEFSQLSVGTILLHDGTTILLSDDMALEGRACAEVPMDPKDYYIREEQVLGGLLRVTVLLPHAQIFPRQTVMALALLGAGLFSVVVLLFGSRLTSRWLARPYSRILEQIARLGQADLSGRLTPTHVAHMDVLVDHVNGMLTRLEEVSNRAFEAQQTLYETRLQSQRLEMYLLHRQIDAHFLYNSLITMKALADQGEAEKAGEVAQGVAMLLRYAHDTRAKVPIFDEMSIIQRYINIMNIRFADRFAVSFEVDDQLVEYEMPRMLLQPLVENALVHGLEPTGQPGQLEIHGGLDGDAVVLSVQDNGVGIPPEVLANIRARLGEDALTYEYLNIQGISLINIQRRIRSAFGETYGLAIESEAGNTRVTLRIPAIREDEGRV